MSLKLKSVRSTVNIPVHIGVGIGFACNVFRSITSIYLLSSVYSRILPHPIAPAPMVFKRGRSFCLFCFILFVCLFSFLFLKYILLFVVFGVVVIVGSFDISIAWIITDKSSFSLSKLNCLIPLLSVIFSMTVEIGVSLNSHIYNFIDWFS